MAGNRRFRAAQLAEVQLVQCIVRDLTDEQVLDIQIAENLHRQDVPPLEEAAAFQMMLDTRKMDVDELAGKIGKSARYVYRRLKLNNLHEKYREHVESGVLPATTAELLASYPQPAQEAVFKKTFWDYAGEVRFDSAPRIKAMLENESCKELKRAIFQLDKENMQPGLVACTRCPKNTAVATLLFPDGDTKPQCTDKACWKVKEAVHIALTVTEWEAYCKAKNIEPHYYDLYYFQGEDKKNIEKVTGREISPLNTYDYERVESDYPGAIEVMMVGGLSWGDEPNLSYHRGFVAVKERHHGHSRDWEVEKINADKNLSEDDKAVAIKNLWDEREKTKIAQQKHRKEKAWKERMAIHLIQNGDIKSAIYPLLKLWVKRLDEDDLDSWWKYLFGRLLMGWRPESFPINQEILEDKEWNAMMVNTWENIIRTADADRDRNIWRDWISNEEKGMFISWVADNATEEDLAVIQSRVMMIEIFQGEKSWSGTNIEVQDYAPLLGDKSPADFEADPEPESEEIEDPDDEQDGDWDANEDE